MVNHDVRSDTANMLAQHYHTDIRQTELIKSTIALILKQVSPFLGAQSRIMHQYLDWAAELHEIGRNIAHSQYHNHGAYIIKHGDLAGFSQQDQNLLSTLVQAHRRKIPVKNINDLPAPWDDLAIYMVIILRLAVILRRNRSNSDIPEFNITLTKKSVSIEFPESWLDSAPLTQADLQMEETYLAKAKFSLQAS
jgi:exopolyphosphatase/guanosine-5'-triphosphate,3'-diphosphate pyrophosphatase